MSAVIFSGLYTKALKPGLNLFNNATIWSGNIDPSASGFTAPEGDIYISTLTFLPYTKQGPLDTDWAAISTVGGSWKTPVTNKAALPATLNTNGDVRITLDTGIAWEWNGSSWQLLNLLQTASVGSTPSASALSVDPNTNILTLEPADATHPGVLTPGAQTIGGLKTLNGGLNVPIIPANTTYTTVAAGIPTANAPSQIVVQGRYAYVTSNSATGTVQIFDLTIPSAPVLVSTFSGLLDYATYTLVQGNIAYAIQAFYLQIYDISNPALPVSVGSIHLTAGIDGATIQGNYVYLACTDSTVQTYDITDPTNPTFVSSIAINSGNSGITSNDKFIFVWQYDTNTFQIFDITDPLTLVLKSTTNMSGTGGNFGFVQDNHFYLIANGSGGFEAWNISDVTAPTLSSSLNVTSSPQTVSVQNNKAYLTNPNLDAVQIIDITDPTAMSVIGNISTGTGSAPIGITTSGRYIYTANSGTGTLGIIDTIGIYVQQLEAGGIETGALTVRTSISVGNDLDVKGSASFGSSVNLQNDLGVDKNIKAIGTIAASNFSGSSSGTNTGDVTLGTTNGLSLSAQILSLALATSSTPGAVANIGSVNGVATLDGVGKVPLSQLPPTLIEYQGTWNASTNTPALSNSSGIYNVSGFFFIVSTGGTVDFGAGPIAFNSGDWVLYNGSIWERAVQSNIVQSVNGQTGVVTINAINQLTGDGTAGPASGSASAALTLATVNSNVGSFTNSSITVDAKGRITAASNGTAVTSTTLTGFTVGANTTILAADTILSAFGKTQGQINALQPATGDIGVTSFSASASQNGTSVTGLAFSNGAIRAFEAQVSVTTSTLFENFTLKGIQRGSDWQMTAQSAGDASGYTFSINTSGQVLYSSGAQTATLKFRASALPI